MDATQASATEKTLQFIHRRHHRRYGSCRHDSSQQGKKRRRKWMFFVVIGIDWKPKTIYRRYRFRFGIETSYRILRRVRVKTTFRNPALRFFLFGFALLLVNIWAFLR
jgi:IS4 transposase